MRTSPMLSRLVPPACNARTKMHGMLPQPIPPGDTPKMSFFLKVSLMSEQYGGGGLRDHDQKIVLKKSSDEPKLMGRDAKKRKRQYNCVTALTTPKSNVCCPKRLNSVLKHQRCSISKMTGKSERVFPVEHALSFRSDFKLGADVKVKL